MPIRDVSVCSPATQSNLQFMTEEQKSCLCHSCNDKVANMMAYMQEQNPKMTNMKVKDKIKAVMNSSAFQDLGNCASGCIDMQNLFRVGTCVANCGVNMPETCQQMDGPPTPECWNASVGCVNQCLSTHDDNAADWKAALTNYRTWVIVIVVAMIVFSACMVFMKK